MKLSRNIALSCEILAAHKLRTLLSVTGIVVGVASVILVVSIGRGAEERQERQPQDDHDRTGPPSGFRCSVFGRIVHRHAFHTYDERGLI